MIFLTIFFSSLAVDRAKERKETLVRERERYIESEKAELDSPRSSWALCIFHLVYSDFGLLPKAVSNLSTLCFFVVYSLLFSRRK
jgi:hypothetical protein